MKTKDIITSAVFSVLSMAGMLAAAVTNVSGHTAILYPPVAAFFMGLLLYILLTKVPKKGTIMIFCIVPALYFLTTGLIEGMIGIASILLFAFIAECVVSKDRTSASRISAACVIYTLSYSTTGMAENFLLTDHYCKSALEHGINAKVVEDMRQMYEIKPLWLAVIAATALLTFLGTLVARGITKRHLKKVGMA